MEKRSNLWLMTGPPGIGKSTVLSKVVLNLRSRGLIVGGCVTSEVRVSGRRVGFRLRDLLTDEEGELASDTGRLGPRVGKYRVNLEGVSAVGGKSLLTAARKADLIVIDEVGPMELTSPDFRRSLEGCIASGKPILAIIHERMNDPLIEELRSLALVEPIEVSLTNRDSLANEVTRKIGLQVPVRDAN